MALESGRDADPVAPPAHPRSSITRSPVLTTAPPAPPAVQLSDVSFGYDRTRMILTGVTLTVPRGKVVALMGGSGSGKTTILRLIGGVHRASAGSVAVFGRDVGRLDTPALYELRRKMGMLFQFGALFTDLSVFDNVAFPLRERTALPERMIRDLVLMKLDAVGLRGAHHLMPHALSGGMARRVALARAIALDPLVMMYDEPFTGLDPISLAIIGRAIRDLNDALGASSIIVTHDVQESLRIVDHIHFIAGGKVVAGGTPDEVRHSTEPFVRQFVHGETDGPVPFHYPAPAYREDLLRT